ncbi:NAD(P)/FAD-dependent oxidoreductase [Herbidospora cretacea]|uniref:NAD(P)/FAD-dependent oxidoreductase n=1 Tax=Herbidospora cretacea TaxID=28444 RepID=UPI0004C3B55F|nr:FAD-dependent oxidoreductase [Herbidospora cretacea]
MTKTPRIAVLGAGYTGLTIANLLARRTAADVTLVNDRPDFVERMRNHQVAAGRTVRRRPLRDLVSGTGVRLVVDRVTRLDPAARHVELAGAAEPLGYDLLVYALGSHADLDAVPGAAEHACAVAGVEQAQRLRDRLRTAGTVAVVGAGPTGLETAAELAETHPGHTVRLISGGTLGRELTEPGRDHLRRVLDRLGVQVWENTAVAKVDAGGVLLEDGRHLSAEAVAWTAGFTVPALAGQAGLAVDEHGRMLVDATLRSASHPEVYGIGDAAAARTRDGHVLRMGCGPGSLAGACAFHAITARMAGRDPQPLRVKDDTLCIGLGAWDGILQSTGLDGVPHGKPLTGRPVALIKRAVLRVTGRYNPRHPGIGVIAARQG